jgi:tetratricopeptide (TPR) repeat protein
MATTAQVKRRRLIQMAEGYLDLAVVFEDRWDLNETQRKKMADRAIECLSAVNNPLGHKPYILFLKGQAHRVAGRLQTAVRYFRQSKKLDPDNLHCLLALAWCYKRTDQIKLAIKVLLDALKVEPTSAIVHYNLACYGALDVNVELAVMHLSLALDLNTKYRELVADESDFDLIRGYPGFQEVLEIEV